VPSIVWGRHPQEAHDNPYEYEAQEQFVREARSLLADLLLRLDGFTMHFHRDEKSLEKATWMLALDLTDSLLESTILFTEKRHRIAFRLFRDAVETMDLLRVLHSGNERATRALRLWYANKSIPHSESRKHLEETVGADAALQRREYYEDLSKFTHRTYRALLKSYSLGRGNMMVHDSHSMAMLVLPQTIASGLAVLSDLVIDASDCLSKYGPLDRDEVHFAWKASLELHTIPRRFSWK
jgi:hypothetical protein